MCRAEAQLVAFYALAPTAFPMHFPTTATRVRSGSSFLSGLTTERTFSTMRFAERTFSNALASLSPLALRICHASRTRSLRNTEHQIRPTLDQDGDAPWMPQSNVPAPPPRTDAVVSHSPRTLRDLAGALYRARRCFTARACRAGIPPLSRMRNSCPRLRPGIL